MFTDDTIVAVSSAAGPAGRSIVRLSGPRAVELAEAAFSRPLQAVPGFRVLSGMVTIPVETHDGCHPKACLCLGVSGCSSDAPPSKQTLGDGAQACQVQAPCRLYLFRAPRSYTRQDVVELHVPGEVIASLLCSAMIEGGARQAEAGEFTVRAFLSGRLDLSAAEAVADVIDAEADAQLRSAVGVMGGALARLCRPAAAALTEALATVEASIDFADEDIALGWPGELAAAVAGVAGELETALATSGALPPSGHLPRVALAGRPNVGKSSLLNTLAGTDRVIVSALAGTTRDVLPAPAALPGGGQVMLLDAAGLGDCPDPLSRAAGAAARQAVASADAVLFVVDADDDAQQADLPLLEEVSGLNRRAPLWVLANKIDLARDPPARLALLERALGRAALPVSAVTGAGLEDLRQVLRDGLLDLSAPQPGTLLLHERQRRALREADACCRRGQTLLEQAGSIADCAELAALELRCGLAALGELTGQVVAEDVLTAIFARFCIGK